MAKPVFQKTVLQNGVRVLSETHPDTRCVEVGFWIDRGTRDETDSVQGVAHLLEHLVFKGTKKLNTLEIAQKIEAVGGEINAFTTKEHTCYHTSTLAEDFDLSMDVLSQLVSQAILADQEYEKEKIVVLQEILMAKDDIEDRVFDSYFEKAYPDHPLGWMILGTEESIQNLKREEVYQWYKSTYLPENLIISVAGNVNHDKVVAAAEKYLGFMSKGKHSGRRREPSWKPWKHVDAQKNCEQVHVLMGFPGAEYGASDRFDAYILNTLLGGGMTSKLYQKIREENGWAYSVFSMLNTYTDCGAHLLYAATDDQLYTEVTEAFYSEINKVIKNKISKEELEYYRKQAKGQIIIASEDIESRMTSLAVNEMVFGEYKPVDSVINELDRVSVDSVNTYIDKWIRLDQAQCFIFGDLDASKTQSWLEKL